LKLGDIRSSTAIDGVIIIIIIVIRTLCAASASDNAIIDVNPP